LWLSVCTAGCASSTGPYAAASPDHRDTAQAEVLTRQAADLIYTDPQKAERLLREALTADLFHGPAHNNLGVVYLEAGKLYEAAGEFEWARKLMPGHPDPRVNLGLALERGGRIDEAIDAYRSALDAAPEHLATIQALVRCQLRHSRADAMTTDYLDLIALRGEPDWREWARGMELMLVDRDR
jgi:tetratricopeptide (TPR) repeat protein